MQILNFGFSQSLHVLHKALASLMSVLLIAPALAAQTTSGPESRQEASSKPEQKAAEPVRAQALAAYILGPEDIIVISAFEAEEISGKPFPVDSEGFVNLPRLGRVRAAGLTTRQLEADIVERLKPYVRVPQVAISIAQFRKELVFLIGAFNKPGTYPLEAKRNLSELISLVGGLQPTANPRIKVTRRLEYGRIPLPNAIEDPERNVSEVEIDTRRLLENISSREDILIKPLDLIRASPKEKVYVSGSVLRPGALELENRENLPVSQVLSMVGIAPDADLKKAVVLRPVMDTNRRAEIPLDIKKIMKGEANDFPLLPNDVLVVPRGRNWSKVALIVIPAATSALISALIYTSIN